MTEATLWKWFSLYIRLRDSDEHGYCRCFTCPRVAFYKEMDCGHGHGRQHGATKYNEKNNHAQCAVCNAFEGGMRDRYKENVDKKYGKGTWDMLEVASRARSKRGSFEIKTMANFYRIKAQKLLHEKGLSI